MSHAKYEILTLEDILCLAGISLILIGLPVFFWWSANANSNLPPDKAVLAAAAQVSPSAVVSNSQYSWRSGCDRSDWRVYQVTVGGERKAIICQGSVITLFGLPTKAPTLRYVFDEVKQR